MFKMLRYFEFQIQSNISFTFYLWTVPHSGLDSADRSDNGSSSGLLTNGAPTAASLGRPVLPHVSCDGVADFHIPLVLSIIVHKLSIRSHQVHDDGVVHLDATRGRRQGSALPRRRRE